MALHVSPFANRPNVHAPALAHGRGSQLQHRLHVPVLPSCAQAGHGFRGSLPGKSTSVPALRAQQTRPRTAVHAFDPALLARTSPALVDAAWCVAAGVGAKIWTKLFDILVANGLLEKVSHSTVLSMHASLLGENNVSVDCQG